MIRCLICYLQFFSMDMYGADGRPLNEKQIHKLLSKIVSKSQTEGPAVGILTSGHRNNWYNSHKQLVKCMYLSAHDRWYMHGLIFIMRGSIFLWNYPYLWDTYNPFSLGGLRALRDQTNKFHTGHHLRSIHFSVLEHNCWCEWMRKWYVYVLQWETMLNI